MKVTPVSRKFGKYQVGDVFEMKDNAARLFIKVGKLKEAGEQPAAPAPYNHRMMTAETSGLMKQAEHVADTGGEAPYGYTKAGTPRKRPAPAAK